VVTKYLDEKKKIEGQKMIVGFRLQNNIQEKKYDEWVLLNHLYYKKPSETPIHSPLLPSSFFPIILTKHTNNIILQV